MEPKLNLIPIPKSEPLADYLHSCLRPILISSGYRGNQEEIVSQVMAAIHEGKRNILLNLPTGYGKSFIANKIYESLANKEYRNAPTAFFITYANNLLHQYSQSFEYLHEIVGGSNYTCALDDGKPVSKLTPCQRNTEAAQKVIKANYVSCLQCPFKRTRVRSRYSYCQLTNYHYYIYSHKNRVEPKFIVADEAHRLPNLMNELVNPDMEELEQLQAKLYPKLSEDVDFIMMVSSAAVKDQEEYKALKSLFASPNYLQSEFHQLLTMKRYDLIQLWLDFIVDADPKFLVSLGKLRSTFTQFYEKISLLQIVNETGVDTSQSFQEQNKEMIEKVFISRSPEQGIRLFLSATLDEDFFKEYFFVDHSLWDSVFSINLDPVFPVEHRKIFIPNSCARLNRKYFDDPNKVEIWCKMINLIINNYPQEKGFVYVPSFKLATLIAENIDNPRLIVNDSSENTKSCMEEFISSPEPKVLVSANIVEGYDFKDDQSRFQIIAKLPFPDISLLEDYDQVYYNNRTITSLLQIYGRSIRSEDDYADTFILDGAMDMLYRAKTKSGHQILPAWFMDTIKASR